MFISLGKATQQMTMDREVESLGAGQALWMGEEHGLWLLQSRDLVEGGWRWGRWGRMKATATHPGGGDAWAEAHVQVWCIWVILWVTGLKGRKVVTGLAGSGANPEQMEESITETETLADDQGCRGKHMHGRGQNDPEVGGGDYVMLLFNESAIPKCWSSKGKRKKRKKYTLEMASLFNSCRTVSSF